MSEIITQEISNLTSKLISSPYEYSLQLKNLFKNLENARALNQKEIISYLLLLAANDCWTELSLELDRLQIKDFEHKMVLHKLSKKFKSQPYVDLHKEIKYFEKVKDDEINIIASVLSLIYEQKQLNFISKIYSNISLNNFYQFFSFKYPIIQDLLEKYDITTKDNFVLLNSSKLIFNSHKTNEKIENLQFLNKNTTDIENIVRANPSTYYFPEQLV